MTDYRQPPRDCTKKGYEHTWSDPKARKYNIYVTYEEGEPYFIVLWEEFQCCLTEFEYHTGGRTGSIIEGMGCQIEHNVETHRKKIPLDQFPTY